MDARIISLDSYRARPTAAAGLPAVQDGAAMDASSPRLQFWTGASGRRYVHTIFSLIECPAMPSGNYILVHRNAEGQRTALAVGRVSHEAASLNLAEIRRRGARLGADEVHVHLLAPDASQSRLIESDLVSAQLAQPAFKAAAAF